MLKNIFAGKISGKGTTQAIVVVSGLPRSGTSMMMKMLAEGGLPLITDEIRSADGDNPNGYFEYEPAKQLTNGDDQWLTDARGKVVKIISALLEYLPARHHYKILFMEREIHEILASQKKMLAHRGESSDISDAEMEQQFREHLSAVKFWLARQPNVDVSYIDYNRLLTEPKKYCRSIADFIAMSVDLQKMESVPDRNLYRNRTPQNRANSIS